MVVIGEERVDFVVVQSVNGVTDEDCQELELRANADRGVTVEIARAGRRKSFRL